MAVINVDDIYILDETGAQVDQVTGLYSKNENASDTEKAQARANIGAGGSNDNLLDNAYFVGGGSQLGDGIFPINQRGQSSYASDGTGIDRWKQFAATVTLESDGVTVTPSTYSNNFLQIMNPAKWNALVGETVTLSIEVLAVTGTITVAGYNTGIGTITSTGIAAFTFTMPSGIADGNKFFGLAGQSGTSIKFGRWKLEKGTISTLANDVPPNYWLELQKCKARLRFVPFTRCPIVFAAGNAYLDLNGCEMEGTPIAALYSNQGAVVGSSGASSAITSVTNIGINHNVPLLQFNLTSAINDQVGQIYNTVVMLSSEI